MNIVLFGAPLSGKGTQADLIKSEYGLVHISTGDMLREIAKQNTDLGFQVHKLLEEGKRVPDEVIIKVLKEKLISINSGNGIILDGFPRTLYQAEILEDVLHIDYVIYLKIYLLHHNQPETYFSKLKLLCTVELPMAPSIIP